MLRTPPQALAGCLGTHLQADEGKIPPDFSIGVTEGIGFRKSIFCFHHLLQLERERRRDVDKRQRAGRKVSRTDQAANSQKENTVMKVSSRVSLTELQGEDVGQRQPLPAASSASMELSLLTLPPLRAQAMFTSPGDRRSWQSPLRSPSPSSL